MIEAIPSVQPTNLTWSGPLVITQGGVYTGNWQSLNASVSAVNIETTQPVVILNANIRSMADLITTSVDHTNVTVMNTTGWGLNPNVLDQAPGRFVDDYDFDNIDIENDTMISTAGIELGYYMGDGSASQTVTVLRNIAQNIDGRFSDGNGGFLTGPNDSDLVQFVQLNACHNLAGVQIAWNQDINQPGESRVEDNISIFQSSGTASSPIRIHDNYIQGAYPADPADDDTYSGGGIMLSDGQTNSAATDTGYVQAYNNFVISTSNYGMAISSGHDDSFYDNTIISSGLLPDGAPIASQNVGAYIWNEYDDPFFGNDSEYDNTIGWMGPSGTGRNDSWTPNASGQSGDTNLPGTVTLQTEQAQYPVWVQRVSAAGMVIGAKPASV